MTISFWAKNNIILKCLIFVFCGHKSTSASIKVKYTSQERSAIDGIESGLGLKTSSQDQDFVLE